MDNISAIDKGKTIDWGKTSTDYARYRPGPPLSFYQKLQALDVGLAEQKILDLGTGTGDLARQFAKQGAIVSAIDIAAEQIAMAKTVAQQQGLTINFSVSAAEKAAFANASFDVITANQCWLYFDKPLTIANVKNLLVDGGLLVTSHFSWLPRLDEIAYQSEQLILKHNPAWSAHDWNGQVTAYPDWAKQDFSLRAFFYYDQAIPFTQETWRGRIRACRGIGASLSPAEIAAFDKEHAQLLAKIAPEQFTVLHRLDARMLEIK